MRPSSLLSPPLSSNAFTFYTGQSVVAKVQALKGELKEDSEHTL
jgi:hypothetical protein